MNTASRNTWKADSPLPASSMAGGVLDALLPHVEYNDQSGLNVVRISTNTELANLKTDWEALEAELADSQLIFQSHSWCSAWADTFMETPEQHSLCVLAAHRTGKVVAILPVMIKCSKGIRVAQWLSEPYAQYGGILISPDEDRAALTTTLFNELKSQRDIDLVHLRHVRKDTDAWEFCANHLKPSGYRETAPFMDLSAFADDEAYQARYTKTQRRRRKKIATSIEQIGAITFTKYTSGNGFTDHCKQIIDNKQTWIAERGLHTSALHCPNLAKFLNHLANNHNPDITTVITETTAGKRGVSHEIGLRYKSRHCAFITAHDTDLTDLSPARLHMDRSQRLALADGMRTFDLMVPGDTYKASWSSGSVEIGDFACPLNLRGYIYHYVYVRTLRHILRAAYLRAPGRIRLVAMSLLQPLMRK